MDRQAVLNRISKGAGLLLTGIVISKLFTYLYRLAIARHLGPGVYGIFSIGLAVIGVLLSFSLLGMPQGILRFVSYYKGKEDEESISAVINNAIKIVLPISILLSILLFAFAGRIAISIFHEPQLALALRILSFSIPVSAVASCIEYAIQAFSNIKPIVITRNLLEPIAKLLLTVIVLYLGYSLAGIAVVYAITMLLVLLSFLWFLMKIRSLKEILRTEQSLYKQLLSFSLPLMLSDLFISLLLWSDTLILGYFVPSSAVGIYNAAIPTARLIHIIPAAIRALFIPTISGLYAQKKNIASIYRTITKWLFLTGIPTVTLLSAYSRQLLSIFFGAAFSEGYIPLVLVALSFFAYSLAFPSENILMVMKKTKLILFNTSLAVMLNIVLNILLIPRFGINGAALATASAFMLITFLVAAESYYFTRIFPMKLNYLLTLIAAFVPLVGVIYLGSYIDSYRLLGLFALGAIYLVLYLLLLLLTKSMGKTEFAMMDAAWQKFRRMF